MKWYHWILAGTGVALLLSQANRYRVTQNLKTVQLGKNFTLDEFVRTATGLDNVPDDAAIANLKALVDNILQPLRDYLGKPIIISSGYRSAAVNKAVGSSAKSQHAKGQAADFSVPGMNNDQLVSVIRSLRLPYDQLIDEKIRGGEWIHISYNPQAVAQRGHWLTARDPQGTVVYQTMEQLYA